MSGYAGQGRSVMQGKELRREVRTMLQAHHPNLVNVEDIFLHGRKCYFVMQKISPPPEVGNPDLFDYVIRFGVLDTGQACQVVFGCARALMYLNTVGLVHRDIKVGLFAPSSFHIFSGETH